MQAGQEISNKLIALDEQSLFAKKEKQLSKFIVLPG